MARWLLMMAVTSCATAPVVQISAAAPKGHCGQDIVVIGAVSKPGKFEVRMTPTLLQAIEHAGGFTQDAHAERVIIERCAGEKWEEIRVAANRVPPGGEGDLSLKEGDIVHVPAWVD